MVSLGFISGLALTGATNPWFANPVFAAVDISDGIAKLPAFIADFRRDRHALTSVALASVASAAVDTLVVPQSVAFSDMFSFTRGSVAEYVDAVGMPLQAASDVPRFDYRNGYRQLLLEGPATNLFLNAFAPATQTIAIVNGSQYTVSCRGSGSLVLSGAATGTVTQGTPLTFTASSASLTLTVSEVLSRAQVETGAVASSFVQTGAVSATRSADSCRLSPIGEALVQKSAVTLSVRAQGLTGSLGRLVGVGDEVIRLNTAQTSILTGATLALSNLTVPLPACGVCIGWNASGRSGSYNGTVANSEATVPTMAGQVYLGRNQTGLFAAGRYDSLVIWPFRATNAALQAKSLAYS
ncbi:hypothetical protein ADU59_05135 [Pararhizobium polonicum]|uniref:Uncharacterized protein n=1 Tax=Pararhizobium polonicum TaxID=1612624 RepID=A0A1C7P796_9HYPH|nr:hypothetical protein [Pararhizobium polonicum]OBZ97071.1 hypothetical protein ADU59_05135 [Pararhizobium polonicum]